MAIRAYTCRYMDPRRAVAHVVVDLGPPFTWRRPPIAQAAQAAHAAHAAQAVAQGLAAPRALMLGPHDRLLTAPVRHRDTGGEVRALLAFQCPLRARRLAREQPEFREGFVAAAAVPLAALERHAEQLRLPLVLVLGGGPAGDGGWPTDEGGALEVHYVPFPRLGGRHPSWRRAGPRPQL